MVEIRERPDPATMTPDAILAEMESLGGRIEVPIGFVMARINDLIGRHVFIHEIGMNWEGLKREAVNRHHPTMREIIDLIPEVKRILIEEPET